MIPTKPKVQADGLYTISQASKALEIDRHTLMRWAEQGRIPYSIRKFDKKKIVRGEAILQLWEEME